MVVAKLHLSGVLPSVHLTAEFFERGLELHVTCNDAVLKINS